MSVKVHRARVRNTFCPTGPGGGVDPTCSPGGFKRPRFSKAITDPKEAAKAIAGEVRTWADTMVKRGTIQASDVPTNQQLEENWGKLFRAKKGNEGDKPAFKDLTPELGHEINKSIKDNLDNPKFQQFVDAHGDAPVIYRRAEKGNSGAAEWRGGIHIYDSPFWKGEGTDELRPGQATAGGMGGYSAVIRHEYGHKLHGLLTGEQQREWRSLLPDSETVRKGLTSYGAKNAEEAFCELFAITTDKRYQSGVFPKWVDELAAKQSDWLGGK